VQLVDANVLLYAVNRDAPKHEPARTWLDGALSAQQAVGFAWVVLLAFLRLSTRAGVFPRPLTPVQAGEVVEVWLDRPPAVVIEPTRRHLPILRSFLAEAGTAANIVNDAHLAALAVEHDAELVSFDRDFARFAGVRTRVPT
jgi:toxin-antitoxin system PIN domain toxin